MIVRKHYFKIILSISLFLLILSFIYSLFNFGKYNHFDEWVGRGLYPGIAFAKGFDLYEPKNGPHPTSYGWASAFFYSPTGFFNSPNQAIYAAYCLNILGFFTVIFMILKIYTKDFQRLTYLLITLTTLVIITLALLDGVTVSVSKIHSDAPASIFLIVGLIIYVKSTRKLNQFIASFFLVFAVMAKLPVLPGLLAPLLVSLLSKEYKTFLKFTFFLILVSILLLIPIHFLFGISDYFYYHANQTNTWGWVDRYDLFNSDGAKILNLSYIEAMPILVRFFLMYAENYWFLFFPTLLIFSYSIWCKDLPKRLMFLLSSSYLLTLPACLAALAHWGGWYNSLFICNILALISISSFLYYIIFRNYNLFDKFICVSSLTCITLVVLLVSLRYSVNAPEIKHSPYEQAFNYLKAGNEDIFFGWYPIPHALYDNSNYTSLEVPIWVGMAKNYDFAFSENHFPKRAKIFATSKSGYGSTVLKPFLGEIKEIKNRPELSHWRLFKIEN